MSQSKHLLTVWNPSYAVSAMDSHLEVLLGWAEQCHRGEATRDDVYVWWGKIRSPNRQQPLPHRDQVLALQQQIEAGVETHLYLTDYRSLYVAKLDEITDEDVLADNPDEIDHMPHYYKEQHVDFWFLIEDIRLLVADDTVATVEELKKLRNSRYHDRPVSIYGGMVDLPLIVWREDEPAWFDPAQGPADGRLWAEHDVEMRSEIERVGRELRDNLFGRDVWATLEPQTRTFLAASEATFRSHRDDPRFDFSGAVVGYVKAVETELNALIFPALRRVLTRLHARERMVNVDGQSIDLGGPLRHQPLGTLRNLLMHGGIVERHLRVALPHDWSWVCGTLPEELRVLQDIRNPAAHSEASPRETVSGVRDRVVGIGREGLIVRIARARMRG